MSYEIQEIRAALFEGEFPDPERLIDLAIDLPPDLFPAAIDFALKLTPVQSKLLLVLVILAPPLPQPLLRRAITATQRAKGDPYRTEILSVLARHAPQAKQQELFEEILEEATSELIESLSPYLSDELLKKGVQQAWERAKRLRYGRAQELIGLLAWVQRTKLTGIIDDAVAAAQAETPPAYQSFLLTTWASKVPQHRRNEAFEICRRIDDPRARFLGLSRLIPYLPARRRKALIKEALAAADDLASLDELSNLARNAKYLSPHDIERLLTILQDLRVHAERGAVGKPFPFPSTTLIDLHSANVLEDVALHLPANLVGRVRSIANSITNPADRARSLASLARHYPTAEGRVVLADSLALALGMADARDRHRGLHAVARYLPKSQQASVLTEAVNAAWEIETDRETREWYFVGDVIKTMASVGYVELALNVANTLNYPTARSRALYDVAQHAPKPQRQRLFDQALAVARTSSGTSLVGQSSPALMRALHHLSPEIPEAERLLKVQKIAIPSDRQAGSEGGNEVGDPGEPWRQAIAALASDEKNALWVALRARLEEEGPAANERIVSTGFADTKTPEQPIPKTELLKPDQPYYFWLEIGQPVLGSIEETPTSLPIEHLPTNARLTVLILGVGEGLDVQPEVDTGELQLSSDGSVVVVRQPEQALGPSTTGQGVSSEKRLFFPIRTSGRRGVASLLCNIYCEQVLVQSRLVEADVDDRPSTWRAGLRSRLLYSLSTQLEPRSLVELKKHDFSFSLSEVDNGKTSFCFFGATDKQLINSSAAVDSAMVQDLIEQARKALRIASWGNDQPWQEGSNDQYLYDQEPALAQLQRDLVRFAIRGYRFLGPVLKALAPSHEQRRAYIELMRRPGLIQLANVSARFLIPAALVYDYDLDTNAAPDAYQLCKAFLDALGSDERLENSLCFRGDCPSRGQDTVVCPSGFWGYRHRLGMPITASRDVSGQLACDNSSRVFLGVWTGKDFKLRKDHEDRLRSQCAPSTSWERADSRKQTFDLLATMKPHLVYFYCHGGWDSSEKVPFILVGDGEERGITPDNLGEKGIHWLEPRPLVFINGCHTTALEPDKAIEFVSAFVEDANASGVIGTDITVFEPLASTFAEECLKSFLTGSEIGNAMRTARLALLKRRNPLGLAYIPFVIGSLRLTNLPDAH